MINDSLNKLQTQISNLESKIEKLEKSSINKFNNLGFSIFNKNLLNFKISDRRKFHIATLNNNQNNHLFFQIKTSFYNYSEQKIQIDLYCNNIKIGSEIQTYYNNICESTICGTFQNLVSNSIDIYLAIIPKNKKFISVLNSSLTVWGIQQTQSEEYDAIQTDNDYCLSFISNNNLYFKLFNKYDNEPEVDFLLKGEYISHSLCKDNQNNILLFKTDSNNNLFLENLQTNQEIFITKKVKKVSSCYLNNSIYFSTITSNNECFFGEIINNVVVSNKKITSLFGEFSSCYLYSNIFTNRCYLILTKKDGSNYLLESIPENFKTQENIFSEINLNITIKAGV